MITLLKTLKKKTQIIPIVYIWNINNYSNYNISYLRSENPKNPKIHKIFIQFRANPKIIFKVLKPLILFTLLRSRCP